MVVATMLILEEAGVCASNIHVLHSEGNGDGEVLGAYLHSVLKLM